jgi:hypothetical protein
MIHHREASASTKAARRRAGVLAFLAAASIATAVRGADFAEGPESVGAACSIGAPPWAPPVTAETLPWRSVWLGHFSGGRPDPYLFGRIDWRDELVCFPSKASCRRWAAELRRAYHKPEGYWTCLLLR